MAEPKQRGGKRAGAGRKTIHGGKSVAIRINAELLPLIEQLKAKGMLENCTKSNEAELRVRLEELKATNLALVRVRDAEHQRANNLQNQVHRLKQSTEQLRAELNCLQHAAHDCQAIKASGERCNRIAKGKVNYHGVWINVCLQHQNQLMKATTP